MITNKLKQELEAAQARKLENEAKIQAIQAEIVKLEAAQPEDSIYVKMMAVGIHTLICVDSHKGHNPKCLWHQEDGGNDAAKANWNQTAHALWLNYARSGIAFFKSLGVQIIEPPAPTPEPEVVPEPEPTPTPPSEEPVTPPSEEPVTELPTEPVVTPSEPEAPVTPPVEEPVTPTEPEVPVTPPVEPMP